MIQSFYNRANKMKVAASFVVLFTISAIRCYSGNENLTEKYGIPSESPGGLQQARNFPQLERPQTDAPLYSPEREKRPEIWDKLGPGSPEQEIPERRTADPAHNMNSKQDLQRPINVAQTYLPPAVPLAMNHEMNDGEVPTQTPENTVEERSEVSLTDQRTLGTFPDTSPASGHLNQVDYSSPEELEEHTWHTQASITQLEQDQEHLIHQIQEAENATVYTTPSLPEGNDFVEDDLLSSVPSVDDGKFDNTQFPVNVSRQLVQGKTDISAKHDYFNLSDVAHVQWTNETKDKIDRRKVTKPLEAEELEVHASTALHSEAEDTQDEDWEGHQGPKGKVLGDNLSPASLRPVDCFKNGDSKTECEQTEPQINTQRKMTSRSKEDGEHKTSTLKFQGTESIKPRKLELYSISRIQGIPEGNDLHNGQSGERGGGGGALQHDKEHHTTARHNETHPQQSSSPVDVPIEVEIQEPMSQGGNFTAPPAARKMERMSEQTKGNRDNDRMFVEPSYVRSSTPPVAEASLLTTQEDQQSGETTRPFVTKNLSSTKTTLPSNTNATPTATEALPSSMMTSPPSATMTFPPDMSISPSAKTTTSSATTVTPPDTIMSLSSTKTLPFDTTSPSDTMTSPSDTMTSPSMKEIIVDKNTTQTIMNVSKTSSGFKTLDSLHNPIDVTQSEVTSRPTAEHEATENLSEVYTKEPLLYVPPPTLPDYVEWVPDYDFDLSTLLFSGRYVPTTSASKSRRHRSKVDLSLNYTWPSRRTAEIEGDILLGGLMMVHEREDTRICGPVMPQGGVQALEIMLYTIDYINNNMTDFIPGVRVGASVLDDCDKDSYGLEQAVDFIKGSISNIDDGEYKCRDGSSPEVRNKVISGVVGAASSVTSIQVANLLRLFRIPQVSFFSTSPELSNKQRFEYFSRTIPSDHYQVKAMVQIVQKLGWSYISIIYEESNYGIKAFEELEGLLAANHICIAVKEKLVKDSGVAEEVAYDLIVQRLLQKQRARGVIIFGSDQEVAGVMRAVRRNNATASFSWIGSDGWSARSLVSSGNEPEVEGTLSVQPQANPVTAFDEYFLALTVENNKRNPWFVEYWEDHFKCRYPGSARTPYNGNYTTTCTGQEKLTKHNTQFEAQLQFVSDAVMAFGYAFRDMHRDLCGGQSGLCPKMTPIDGEQLLSYLRKVNFTGLSGDSFRFDQQGDGPARYNIIHFKQTSPARYDWVTVGQYVQGELRLNMSALQFKLGQPWPPSSVCSLPCLTGQAKKYVEGESCCWHCFNCSTYQIVSPTNPTQCVTCAWGTLPSPDHLTCNAIPEVYIRPDSWWAIGAMLLSSVGVVMTSVVVWVFVRHNDTPVVRASGRELSYVLLSGVFLCYAVTFVFVLKPSAVVCGVQRFGLGFCFAVVYSALLTKTNRIARIFNAGKRTAKRPSLISPRSQLCICFCTVSVQVMITGVWWVMSPPRAIHHYLVREDNFLVCAASINASYMIAFAYPIDP
ncbi:uncharacterized protein [Panulirus ornatus]|uniref:uncharacterized protein isoform X2 n=1 Tax=Panulirus ornatus TaxID=150431 RepID=UPI003A8A5329